MRPANTPETAPYQFDRRWVRPDFTVLWRGVIYQVAGPLVAGQEVTMRRRTSGVYAVDAAGVVHPTVYLGRANLLPASPRPAEMERPDRPGMAGWMLGVAACCFGLAVVAAAVWLVQR